ncbi:hypothetical protein F5X96DRAFT_268712 [Biscogniauxia mediterranea]|nr:hypothetical protein F5X96DRAFT_268712 [Biscogniauxia mediterranea]
MHSLRMSERSHHEMLQKSRLHDPFFGLKGFEPRPNSMATEIVDTDWDEEDDDDIVSEIEDDDPNSPRVSLNSSGQQSATTLSSYDEAHTPRSSRAREAYLFDYDPAKPVEGPRGPHLFRSSTTSSTSAEYQEILSLSPITPKTARPYEADVRYPLIHDPLPRSRTSPYQFTHEKLDPNELAVWSPQKVAQWMLDAGVERLIAEKFIENDINGAILITLKFEDLRELDIQSFGVRTKIWGEIHNLRDRKEMSPRPETPIEDEESRKVRRERRRMEKAEKGETERSQSVKRSRSVKRSHSKRRPSHEDIISPLESVSIVGIEQMMPKPHHCKKGENCSKYRRYQRMMEAFKKDHPFVDTDKGGIIMVAGDPGNPETAQAINRPSSTEVLRPVSDAVPSVIASSDVLGPGVPPLQYLQEAALRNLQTRDPQDNVRQFLDFQHTQTGSNEVPPTPPFEIYPSSRTPHEGLRALPKLSIPGHQQAQVQKQSQQARQANSQTPFVPYRMERAEALSPDLQTPVAPYRFGTPFSDMDVPLTAVPLGPVARDASQSVPPDMNYRAGPVTQTPRQQKRSSHRPSLQIMAPLQEDASTPVARTTPRPPPVSVRTSPPPKIPARSQQPLHAPPRAQWPWSPQHRHQRSAFERTLPNMGGESSGLAGNGNEAMIKDAEGITYQGPVKKRKTKMLRHEWHDQYAVLKGTRLALHKDAQTRERTLEYIDIDDYAIACSSLSTTSKLNAAFKAMSISRGRDSGGRGTSDHDDVAAFSFQLIPQDVQGGGVGSKVGARLRKRESQSPSQSPNQSAVGSSGLLTGSGLEGSVNGTGKTHHFAVRSRDERIDWMRELMLAKALKQKGEGFEVSVNGNMI